MSTLDYEPILAYIDQYIAMHGIPPTRREIADGCFISSTTAQYHVQRLIREGKLSYHPKQARGIQVVKG